MTDKSGDVGASQASPDRAASPSGLSPCGSSRSGITDAVRFSRAWAMPSRDTFSIWPIREFMRPFLARRPNSVDPFARNNDLALVTNDLNPAMRTHYHMEAESFCKEMAAQGRMFDLAFFDPPYSPRQISECYNGIGLKATTADTQNAALYRRVRDALLPILSPQAVVLSFGWNSSGMGVKRGFALTDILLVAHGGAHNDTICIAERRARHDAPESDQP